MKKKFLVIMLAMLAFYQLPLLAALTVDEAINLCELELQNQGGDESKVSVPVEVTGKVTEVTNSGGYQILLEGKIYCANTTFDANVIGEQEVKVNRIITIEGAVTIHPDGAYRYQIQDGRITNSNVQTQAFLDGCNRHYQSAVKFIVDTPVVHPFSVSANSKVIFSRGNLQYCPAKDEWRFALRQFDRVGNGKAANPPAGAAYATAGYGITTVFYDSTDYSTKDPASPNGYKIINGVPCNNLLVSKNYQGWIDLFAWGTSGHGKKVGDEYAVYFYPYDLNNQDVNTTYNRYGYGPSYGGGRGPGAKNNNFDTASGTNRYFDWGYANHIREYSGCSHSSNGSLLHAKDSTMYAPGVWRTLTSAEWTYLLTTRKVGDEDSAFSFVRLKYGENATDTVSGMIIYPDDFSFSEAGVASMKFGAAYAIQATINAADWAALEEAGCIFLPYNPEYSLSTGTQSISEDTYGNRATYNSASAYTASSAYFLFFNNAVISPRHSSLVRYCGMSVRLVQDLE